MSADQRDPDCACPPETLASGRVKFGCPVHGRQQVGITVKVVNDMDAALRWVGWLVDGDLDSLPEDELGVSHAG